MKKIVLIIVFCLMIGGCTNKGLKDAYENMQIGEDLKGYAMDLRIYGKAGNERVNEIIKIYNYNNTDYKITKQTPDRFSGGQIVEGGINIGGGEETTYIKDGKVYISDEEGNYVETIETVSYSNPQIFLEGIKNVTPKEVSEEKIGEKTYKVYKFDISKNMADKIIEQTGIDNIAGEKAKSEAYIDAEGFVYRIIYSIDDLTININYFSINNVQPINIPVQK